jgi:hypothetical protein
MSLGPGGRRIVLDGTIEEPAGGFFQITSSITKTASVAVGTDFK